MWYQKARRSSFVLFLLVSFLFPQALLGQFGGGDGSVTVTPDGGSASASANSSGNEVTFTVKNTGDDADYFTLSCSRTGSVSGCTSGESMVYLGANQQTNVDVTYSTGSAGSGTVTLEAWGMDHGGNDSGYYNVTVTSAGVLVTPANGTTPNRDPYTGGHEASFTVKNEGSSYATFNISCLASGGVNCPGTDKQSVGLNGGSQTTVKAYYAVSSAGDGNLKLIASNASVQDTGSYTVPVGGEHGVFVGRDGLTTMEERSDGPLTREFFVKNTGNTAATYNLSCARSGAVSSCTVGSSSVNIDPGVTHIDTVTYYTNTNATGWLRLRAVKSGSSTIRDSAKVTVNTVATNQPLVSVEEAAPGSTHDRSQCLTFGIGPSAAWQCGDLVLSHPLPSVQVLGKARTPTLVYNSLNANPNRQIVAAHVTLQSGANVPDSIVATVTINSQQRATAKWPGNEWSAGQTRRIAIAVDAYADTTGIYPYTLEVASWYGANRYPTTASSEYALVNRRYSAFGSGWWLAGLEELLSVGGGDWLWIGSDGSTKRYEQVTSSVWAAEHQSRPDTLKLISGKYVRFLPHGDSVVFDSYGQHVRTGNRLDHQTTFSYSSGRLTQIALPTEGGTNTYGFSYDGNNKLRTVTGPRGRQTKVYVSSSRTDSIVDPDTTVVKFTHDGSSKRILRRTDRRGTVTSFVYGSVSYRVKDAYINMGSDSIHTFEGWNQLWLGRAGFANHQSRPLGSVYTYIRWPRRYASGGDYANQWTRFDHNRYGAVTRIRNALVQDTWVTRGDAQYEGLVTHVEHPNDWVQHAGYDERGNIIVSTDSSTNATTHYTWDEDWNFVTSVVTPEGDRTDMGYSSSNGNRLWQQDSRGRSSRVEFSYYSTGCTGMLWKVDGPLTPESEVAYNSNCNLYWSDTPQNYRTYYYKDGIGRDTLIVTPIDATKSSRQRIVYDIMGRVDETETIGPAMSYSIASVMSGSSPADTMWVGNTYDEEGNLTNVARAAGDKLIGSISYSYDRANRRITEFRGHGGRDSTFYDPAGNVTKVKTRRGHTITMKYDVLDRLIRRSVPQVAYDSTGCAAHGVGGHPGCDLKFPMYPDPGGTGLTIAARVDTFAYDVMGNMTRAWNNFSRVTRTYNANGALATEVQTLRRYGDTQFDKHTYNLTYVYDLNGRRTALIHPDSLVPSSTDTVQLYDYTSYGALESVTNVFGDEHVFSYDAEGRMTGINSPGSSDWTFGYNNDSQLTSRVGPYHNETLTYDRRGLITYVNSSHSHTVAFDMRNFYSGLGHVIATYKDKITGDDVVEEFENDAMGRVTWQRPGGDGTHAAQNYLYAGNGTGRLNKIVGEEPDYPPLGWLPDTTYNEFDAAGNLDLAGRRQYWWVDDEKSGADRRASQSYYSADGKLMVQQTYQDSLNNSLVRQKRRGMYEEYWYDALGRRVLVRRRADTMCTVQHCHSSIERFAWDGDQILYEVRHPGADNLSNGALNYSPGAAIPGSGEQYGIVGYTHGGQIDRPLDVYRMNYEQNPVRFMPTTDYRGTMDAGRTMSSSQFGCAPTYTSGCEEVDWPGKYQMTYRNESEYYRPFEWFGSLVQDKKDGTGLMYMRNRYYDPQTGQFTQEDPIGLAGGLNLYGFAGGDPINFWDPFGLSADSIKGDAKHEAQRVINVFRNSDENDAVNGTQKKIMGAIVDEYDRVASSDTEHLNAVFGVCPKNADAPGCYDHPSRTMTINPDAIEANQSLIWRSQSTVAAHELGHWADWQLWNHSGKEPFANSVEAIFRSVLNLPAKTFRPWR